MKKYHLTFERITTLEIDIEAKDEEEARDIAGNMADDEFDEQTGYREFVDAEEVIDEDEENNNK